MPVELGSVKAEEAIANIRSKVAVPSTRWDDWMGEVNAKGFTVAGATKADLVGDFHQAITSAIENGESIGQFRKRFDSIVEEHGWSYKGKRGWRTRVIYNNNLRSAHMAGRWQQIQRTKKTRPYLIYSTVGDERVRDEHRRWHKLVLLVDDPFWDSHYPPNGWGCRCYVNTANERQLERLGLSVGDAPPINKTERINAGTGEVYGDVPEGIDTGWDFNPGKAWLGPDAAFGERLVKLPKALRAEVSTTLNNQVVDKAFSSWGREALATTGRGSVHTVGWLDHQVITALEEIGAAPTTAAISITSQRLQSLKIPASRRLELPRLMREAKAVLRDGDGALVFVVDDINAVIRMDLRKQGELTNSVSAADTATLEALKNQGNYTILKGEL